MKFARVIEVHGKRHICTRDKVSRDVGRCFADNAIYGNSSEFSDDVITIHH